MGLNKICVLLIVLTLTVVNVEIALNYGGIDLEQYFDSSLPSDVINSVNPIDSGHPEKEYLQWLINERNLTFSRSEKEEPMTVMYRGMYGLGHQLLRLSSAYHFSILYRIPRIYPTENPVCGGNIFTIYDHLIGEGPLLVDVPFFSNNLYRNRSLFQMPEFWPRYALANETNTKNININSLKRTFGFNNEVAGYSVSGGFWAPGVVQTMEKHQFLGKLASDYQMYHQIMLLFEHKHNKRIKRVLDQTRFDDHTVFAFHIRAGNGEKGDFIQKGRNIKGLDAWLSSSIDLLCLYKAKHENFFIEKPMMIFVGTDTGSILPKLKDASNSKCRIPIVSADQTYPDEGKSVSFVQPEKGEKCLTDWESMFLDMYFFTKCNTVITGTYSSFTQSAPLSFIMHKAKMQQQQNDVKTHPHYFCEMGVNAGRMDCSNTIVSWLLREPVLIVGNSEEKKQKIRHELTLPRINSRVEVKGDISQLFKKTIMVSME